MPESRILSIFNDVCAAVNSMHSAALPIAHFDVKLENILHHESGVFKLCDFGSACTTPLPVGSQAERVRTEAFVNQNTTPVYRCPEMVDLYCGHQVWLPADIWALG